MFKLIGAILVISGSTGLGLLCRQDLKVKLHHARCIHTIIELLESEISYSKSSMPEACMMISRRMEEPYAGGLYMVWKLMNSDKGMTFSTVWKQEMGKCIENIKVGKEEGKAFLEIGDGNGYADNAMQMKAFAKCRLTLEKAIKEQEEKMENKSKVVMSMGLIGGLFLTIVLM